MQAKHIIKIEYAPYKLRFDAPTMVRVKDTNTHDIDWFDIGDDQAIFNAVYDRACNIMNETLDYIFVSDVYSTDQLINALEERDYQR